MEQVKRLESWKEISEYLKRSVKTCHRWENELGLPIHRLDGTPSARVFAYPDELNEWMEEKLNHVKAAARGRGLFWSKKKTRLALASGAVVVLGVVGVLAWPLLLPRPVPVPSNNPVLAILPFDNLTGDEVLEDWRTAFPDLLITDLRQSRYIHIAPLLFQALDDLKLGGAKTFSGEDLAGIAEKTEADFMTTGSLLRSGEDIVVNIFVHDLRSKESAKNLRETVRGEQALLNRADDLTKEIKRALNLTPRQIACDIDEKVHRIATRSPRAFKLYSQASHGFMRNPEAFADIVATLQKAIDIDPRFALAYKLLYSVYYRDHIEDAVRCYQKALALGDRLSKRGKLGLQMSFYHRYQNRFGFAQLAEADIPASTIEKLGPKNTGEALGILEKLTSLYPDLFWNSEALDLVRIYRDTEEWDKGISVLEKGMEIPRNKRRLGSLLITFYRAKGWIDKAEKLLEDLRSSNDLPDDDFYEITSRDLAWDRRDFDRVLAYLKKQYTVPGQKNLPFFYFSGVGYMCWLKDDLDAAEEAYGAAVDPSNRHEEWTRSIDMAVLSLSRGKIGQAIEFAKKLLEMIDKNKEFAAEGRERRVHAALAYLYRLSGRLPEALDEAEAACRDYERPDVPALLAVKFLHLKALITLEMGRLEEFERQIDVIKEISERECYPKLMRAYYHLLGLRELGQGRGHAAVRYLNKALDLSYPASPYNDREVWLFSLAEAWDSIGRSDSIRYYREITELPQRGSFSGDIYAQSFYRLAKFHEDRMARFPFSISMGQAKMSVIENYRKFLSLWGDADPIFPEVADAKARLAALEAE